MGRVKLEIKRIENTNNRMVTFAKRKMGLVKKAQELSTLCDIDVALIMFSPGNKLTQYATNSRIEEILFRYANVPEAERAKRKMENLEQLKRAIRKLKGETEPTGLSRNFLDSKGELNVEVAQEEIRRLQSSNDISQKRLRLWQGDDGLLDSCSYEDLLQMEMEVQRTIDKVRMRKQELQFMEYNSKKVEMSGFGCNAWPENKSRDLDMIKYFNKEEAPSENSSSPGSYFGDQRPFPSVDLNQLDFQPAPAPPGLLIPGFDLGLQANSLEQVLVPDRRNNVNAELPAPYQRPTNYQQPHFDGTDPMFFNHAGAGTFMELDCQGGACVVQCDSQADSSQ